MKEIITLPLRYGKELTLNVEDISSILQGADNTVIQMKTGKNWAIEEDYYKIKSLLNIK